MDKKERHRAAVRKYTEKHKHQCVDCGRMVYATSQRCYWCSNKHRPRHPKVPRGEANSAWRGGRHLTSNGYWVVLNREHPRCFASGYVLEHIVLWEQAHGESLPQGMIIHHLNGVKTDNRPVNLVALTSRKHSQVLQAKSKRIQELEALLNNQSQLV